MPIHDWTRVPAGIFHHFHHRWISALSDALNSGLLPPDYYALAEQFAGGFGPDVLTLQGNGAGDEPHPPHGAEGPSGAGKVLLAEPKVRLAGETDLEFYRRKQNSVVVRHVSGDRIVAMVEILSPGNKMGQRPLRAFIEKAATLLEEQIHLTVVDLHPPTARDPQGIHAVIWEELTGEAYASSEDKPLTLAAYEAEAGVRAFVEHVAVGDQLVEMPLYLRRGAHVPLPLETTYETAFAAVPQRWIHVLQD